MNDQQAAFLRQARSDWRFFRDLRAHGDRAACHELHLQDRVRSVLPVAYQVERLAPDLAGGGPNPEYPWPRAMPTIAPVDYDFEAWNALEHPKGRNLISLVDELLESFGSWA